jgi:translation elongation factor TU
MEEIRRVSEELGKEMEFAFVMDHLEEERERGITIDTAHTFFKTEKRHYVIIDAPGHKEFLKNMITGSSQAEAALLLVDAAQGIQDQTRRHCFLLNLLGIKQIAVLVNKMDSVNYSEPVFREVEEKVRTLAASCNIQPTYVLPIAARLGENVATRSENLAWFTGPTVLQALDNFTPLIIEEKDMRFPVQDVYEMDGKPLFVGRVESGVLKKGEEVFVLPDQKKAKIMEILKFQEEGLLEAPTGDCVGIRVEGEPLHRGQILVSPLGANIKSVLHATIFWMIDQEYKLGIPLVWKGTTQEVKCKITKINKRFDPASIEVVETDAVKIGAAEVAEVEISLERPVVVDRFSDIPEMGRFVLEHAGQPVAGGIMT